MLSDIYGTGMHMEGGYLIRGGDVRRFAVEHRSGAADAFHADGGTSRPGDIDVAIIRALRGEAPPPLTALDARNAVAVVDAAYESLAAARAAEVDWRDE
jgi:hypothetical protein